MGNVAGIEELVGIQRGLVRRAQLLSMGATDGQIRWRIRPGGPWQVVLPGVYATFTGTLTRRQRWQAALLYAGDGAVLTGGPALRLWGIGRTEDDRVPVLIVDSRHRTSRGPVTVIRSERMQPPHDISGFPVADPVRATADACRLAADMNQIRAIVTEALSSSKVDLDALRREVDEGPCRGSKRIRMALAEYSDGVRSVAEARARTKLLRLPIPPPRFNVDLVTADGEFVARPDAYWSDASLAFEVDSRRHHGDMEDWERTQRRHARLTAHGVTVIHASPHRITSDWQHLATEIVTSYRTGRTRPPAAIKPAGPQGGRSP